MNSTQLDTVEKARLYATQKHAGQRYGKESYISYVGRVIQVLKRYGCNDPILLSAAWLHNVLEHTHTSLEDIQKAFGIPTAYIVWALTGEFGINRIDRLQGSIAKLRSSQPAITIKLAELVVVTEQARKTNAKMYRNYVREVSYLREVLYKPKQKATIGNDPLWQRLIEISSLEPLPQDNRLRKQKKMKAKTLNTESSTNSCLPKCLEGVMISKELAEAIAAVEYQHSPKKPVNPEDFESLDNIAGEFVAELVRFTREALTDPDNFYNEPDKAAAITLIILENGEDAAMSEAYSAIEQKLHPIEGGDELYNLFIAVIIAVVETEEYSQAKATEQTAI